MHSKRELLSFARNYSRKDLDHIKFKWNGKYEELFGDKNLDFRTALCELIKQDLSAYSDELIIDLYLELSKYSRETHTIYAYYHLFANELLRRDCVKHFDYYLEGASQSIDTAIMSGHLNLCPNKIERIYQHLKQKVDNGLSREEARKYDYMLYRFEWLSKKEVDFPS